MTARAIILLACWAMLASPRSAVGELRVWTVTDTRRVLRGDPPGKSASATLAAAGNEWESFQILLRPDRPVKALRVVPGDLTGPGGRVLPAAEARLFRQHQIEIKRGTYRNDRFRPGWYPDPLVPARHPVTGKPLTAARRTAMPTDVPAGQTHAFWVDLHVPAGAKPGLYRGTYRVTAAGGRSADVPVALTVWDFDLPRVSTLRTALGSPAGRMRSYYRQRAKDGKGAAPSDWAALETQCAEMLTRHRVNATPPREWLTPTRQGEGTYRIPAERIEALRKFIDRHHVNAVMVPHPRAAVRDPDKEGRKLSAWLAAWTRAAGELKRPGVTFYTYLKDEPNDEEAYKYVQKWGRAVRRANSAVRVLVVEQTWTQNADWGDLYGAIDIWVPLFSLFRPDSAAKRQAAGETIWTYTALCQGAPTPWWHIDYPLLNYRVPAWIAWRYRIRGLLYWGGMSYWRQVSDPWTDAWTYGRGPDGKGGRVYNGEGTLVYPGRAAGYDGIAPSLRLKALRDGIEDYEYLAILERLGLAAEAEKVILPIAGSWQKWNPDPAAYEKARAKLAELIVAASKRSGG